MADRLIRRDRCAHALDPASSPFAVPVGPTAASRSQDGLAADEAHSDYALSVLCDPNSLVTRSCHRRLRGNFGKHEVVRLREAPRDTDRVIVQREKLDA